MPSKHQHKEVALRKKVKPVRKFVLEKYRVC